MGFIHPLKTKGDFMKNFKFKKVYLLELAIAITISLGIGSILGMKYFSHLYMLAGLNGKSIMHINKRIDLIDKKIKDRHKDDIKPVSL